MKYLFLLIFVGGGIAMLVVGVRQYLLQRELTSNPRQIKVTITRSDVHVSKSSDTDSRVLRDNSTTSYRPELKFAYTVDGKQYESDLLRPTDIVTGYASHDSAAEVLKPYPLGATVDAWLSPTRPDKAFLLNEPSHGPVIFMFVGVGMAVAITLLSRFL